MKDHIIRFIIALALIISLGSLAKASNGHEAETILSDQLGHHEGSGCSIDIRKNREPGENSRGKYVIAINLLGGGAIEIDSADLTVSESPWTGRALEFQQTRGGPLSEDCLFYGWCETKTTKAKIKISREDKMTHVNASINGKTVARCSLR